MFFLLNLFLAATYVECNNTTLASDIEAALNQNNVVILTQAPNCNCSISGTLHINTNQKLTMEPGFIAELESNPGLEINGFRYNMGQGYDLDVKCDSNNECIRINGGILRDSYVTSQGNTNVGVSVEGNHSVLENIWIEEFNTGLKMGATTPALLSTVRHVTIRNAVSPANTGVLVSSVSNSNIFERIYVTGGFAKMALLAGTNNIWLGGGLETTLTGVQTALEIAGTGTIVQGIRLEFGGSAEANMQKLIHFTVNSKYNQVSQSYIALGRDDYINLIKDEGFHNKIKFTASGNSQTKLLVELPQGKNVFTGYKFDTVINGIPEGCVGKIPFILDVSSEVVNTGGAINALKIIAEGSSQVMCNLSYSAFEGRNFTFGVWVYSNIPIAVGSMRMWITDQNFAATNFTVAAHSGSGWEFLQGRGQAPKELYQVQLQFRVFEAGTFLFRSPVVIPEIDNVGSIGDDF